MASDLEKRLAALTPAQRALFELKARKRTRPGPTRTVPRRAEQNACPLSLDQERLWFIQQLDLESPVYNIYSAVRFRGPLDIPALRWSLNEIVRRHEIMRTSFAAIDGRPVQIIAPNMPVPVPVVDLRSLDPLIREVEAQRVASDQVRRVISLTRPPLFRTVLLRVADDDHVCATVFHHIITDWVSFHVFNRELAVLYDARRARRPSPLPPPAIQYGDYAAWQRTKLAETTLGDHIEYWRAHLCDAPLVLELPLDRPRQPMQTGRGVRQAFALSKANSEAARALAQRESVTPFMLLLAVFQVVLFRITGQHKVIVGSPVASRTLPELEDALGYFLSHLMFCSDFSGDPVFRAALARVRKTALGAYAHADVPFGTLVDILQPPRDLSRAPLTQYVLLFLEPETQGFARFENLTIHPYTVDGESSKFDMTFSLWDTPAGFDGWMEYNADIFDATSVGRLKEQFRTLLRGALVNPDCRLSDLPLLPAHERHQVTCEWSEGPHLATDTTCAHRLVEQQVERTPWQVALIVGEERLTYEALNERANRLAHYLRARAAGPERVVGVYLERSTELFVAVLAAFKSGAACLPIDPAYTRDRLAVLLRDAGATLLVTDRALVSGLEGLPAIVCVDCDSEMISTESAANLAGEIMQNSAAYVIYTSGSTGRPKGIVVSQRAFAAHCRAMVDHYALRSTDRLLHFASIGFDWSFEQLFLPLIAGAAIVVRPPGLLSASNFSRLCRHAHVTVANLPPEYFSVVGRELDGLAELRLLIVGGDVLPKTSIRRPATDARLRLLNAYGPSETTITASSCDVGPTLQRHRFTRSVPIGRPLPSRTFHVLDAQGHPVPVGAYGELHIGGDLLARGYLGRPDATADRFRPDPFSQVPGARLYRTGDIVRRLNDGQLEFIGRLDTQIKLRGFRIELEEIEARLLEHASVRMAAVVMHEQGAHKELCAFVVSSGVVEHDDTVLRAHLCQTLPEYAVPARIIELSELPLLASGKIDRRALPVPAADERRGIVIYVAPRNPIEATLVNVWSEVLGVSSVGVHDNFFGLGGDSILSIQIVARAGQHGFEIQPRQMFEHQTIAELAAVARVATAKRADQGIVTGPVRLTPIQRWFFAHDFADPHHYNHAVLLEVSRDVTAEALCQVVSRVVEHHDALRMRFLRTSDGVEQFNTAPGGRTPFVSVDLSRIPAVRRGDVVSDLAATLQKSLNLQHGPVLRAALFTHDAADGGRLLVIVHHLVIDVASWSILLEDLQTGLEQWRHHTPIAFPAKTTSFRDWAERSVVDDMTYHTSSDSQIPVDYQHGPNDVASARSITVQLAAEHAAKLSMGTLAADAALKALATAFAEWAPETDLRVDVEGRGRSITFDDVDVSRTIGWLTTFRSVSLNGTNAEAAAGGSPIAFNYSGRLDRAGSISAFRPVLEDIGPLRSRRGHRAHVIEIEAAIVNSAMRFTWTFSENLHHRSTIEGLAQRCVDVLAALGDAEASALDGAHRLPPSPGAAVPTLERVARERPLPLSFGQEPFWMLEQAFPGTPLFGIPASIRISGPLDLEVFGKSVAALAERHEILRTTFSLVDGVPCQVIAPTAKLLRVIDLTRVPVARRADEAARIASAEAVRPFDLARGPLLRMRLIRLDPLEHYLVFNTHHIIADGWSTGVFLQQLSDVHRAFAAGERWRLDPLPIQFADYAVWQRRCVAAGCYDEQRAYWTRQLAAPLQPIQLRAAGASRPEPSVRSAVRSYRLPLALLSSLKARSHSAGVSLFILLLAALKNLLARYATATDVRVATLVSTRPRAELHELIGPFINTIILRTNLAGSPTRLEVLRRVRQTVLDAFQNQDLPFEELLEQLERDRPINSEALSPVLFLMQNTSASALTLTGLSISEPRDDLRPSVAMTAFDWIITAEEQRDGLVLSMRYNPRQFSQTEVDAAVGEWRVELEQWVGELRLDGVAPTAGHNPGSQ